jgi:hypothetical protein
METAPAVANDRRPDDRRRVLTVFGVPEPPHRAHAPRFGAPTGGVSPLRGPREEKERVGGGRRGAGGGYGGDGDGAVAVGAGRGGELGAAGGRVAGGHAGVGRDEAGGVGGGWG